MGEGEALVLSSLAAAGYWERGESDGQEENWKPSLTSSSSFFSRSFLERIDLRASVERYLFNACTDKQTDRQTVMHSPYPMWACLSLLECIVEAQDDVPVSCVPEESGVSGLQLVCVLEYMQQRHDQESS